VVYLINHGSPEQKARFLPLLASGELVGAHALSEPDTGSDVLSLRTTATWRGGDYVLNGRKMFVSNAPCADLFVVFARTGNTEAPQRNLSAFLVPRNAPGLEVRQIGKAGLRGTPMGAIDFTDCVIPAANLLGAEGGGYRLFTSTIEWERGFMAATQLGRLQRILDSAIEYSSERRQFGEPIGAYQAVSHRLADMQVRLELSRLMLHKFGWLKSKGRLALLESAILKLSASESLLDGALASMRVHGARGYVTDLPVEREVRDALGTVLYGGTSDIQHNIIASLIGVGGNR